MNLPFKLHEHTGSCVPQGPAFSSAKRVNFSIDGNQIEFYAPRHRPEARVTKARNPDRSYIFKDIIFRTIFDNEVQLEDSWEHSSLFRRCWAFNGPWFTGPLAELCMSFILIRPKALNENVSYFHPRAFEQAMGDYLTNEYGIFKTDGRSNWIAPKHWQPIKSLPVVAARLQVAPDEIIMFRTTREYIFFPVADQCLVVMSFNPAQLQGRGTQSERDKVLDRLAMLDLMEGIIDSLKITLSPEVQAQRDRALQSLEDTSLIKNFPPMKWTTVEEDALWSSKHPDKPPLDKVLKTG